MAFTGPIYSDSQREAVAAAYVPHVVSSDRVAEMAAAGELVDRAGGPLPAFEIKPSTVRDFRRKAQRAAAKTTAAVVALAPRDAIEMMRRDAIAGAQQMLAAEKRKRPEERDPERWRRIARAIREAALIPGPTDPRPAAPGARRSASADARGGGAMLADHRAGDAPVSDPDPEPEPEPVAATESPEQRFERELRADIARIEAEQAEQRQTGRRDLVAASLTRSRELADESRGRRRRSPPDEDTSSWR